MIFNQYPVFVQGVRHVPRRNEDVFSVSCPVIGDQESVAHPDGSLTHPIPNSRALEVRSAPSLPANDSVLIQLVQEMFQTPAIVAVQIQQAGPPEIQSCCS